MTVTMDSAGRIVIPKQIRREAGLEPGVPLQVRCNDGRVEIEPKPMEVRIERRGKWAVAVPVHPVPPMDHEIVEETLRKIRNARGR